jgi:hypothetical protein
MSALTHALSGCCTAYVAACVADAASAVLATLIVKQSKVFAGATALSLGGLVAQQLV